MPRNPKPSPAPDRRTLKRRDLLLGLPPVGLGLGASACRAGDAPSAQTRAAISSPPAPQIHAPSALLELVPLGFPWKTFDPFLFCVHHEDFYPAGNRELGPAASLAGRDLGQDFAGKDGWRMYHGDVVPGFPRHPHRGFETVTVTRRGFIDHSDSLGATARYGNGDVQWMTAGRGIVHAEMFPLLDRSAPNPLELFQIWLNLPAADKMVEPYFTMFWDGDMPIVRADGTEVTVIAGSLGDVHAPTPPPDSYASRADADIAILHIRLDAGAAWTLPPAAGPDTARVLYVFEGDTVDVAGTAVDNDTGVVVDPTVDIALRAGDRPVEILLLQGRPLGEPVAQQGPFVMNTAAEIEQAFRDYRRTGFGGWPWPEDGPAHDRDRGRFAQHVDGRIEEPSAS